MNDLIEFLTPRDKKYFNDKYLSIGQPIPFESNKVYAELLLRSPLPKKYYSIIYNAFQNKINLDFNDSSRIFENFKADNENSNKKQDLESLRKKYDQKFKENEYHIKLKKLLSKNSELNYKIMSDNNSIKKCFNKKIVFRNIKKLIKSVFNIEIYFSNKHINEDMFFIYLKTKEYTKKIIVNLVNPNKEIKYLGCFQEHTTDTSYIGEINIVTPVARKNKHQISFESLTTLIHELGHALEYEINKIDKYKKSIKASAESISLFFEMLFLKNYSYITGGKDNKNKVEHMNWIWNFDIMSEIRYLKNLYENDFNQEIKGEFKTYDFFINNNLKSSAVDSINDIFHYPEVMDEYLIGYLEAEKLMDSKYILISQQ